MSDPFPVIVRTECRIKNCGREIYKLSICEYHFHASVTRCKVDDCDLLVYCKGFCISHYLKDWRARNPGKQTQYIFAWRNRNKERHKAYDAELKRKYRANNPEKFAEIDRKRRLDNLEQYRLRAAERARKRRAAKRNVDVNNLTDEDWKEILVLYQHKCFYCGDTEDLTQDHMIPLSRGGNHTFDNILPACRSCNSKKGTQTLEEFMGWI